MRTSSFPKWESPCCTVRSTCSWSLTSHSSGSTFTPRFSHSCATSSSSAFFSRASRTRSAPSRANASAIALPLLRPAPATSAVLPCSSWGILEHFLDSGNFGLHHGRELVGRARRRLDTRLQKNIARFRRREVARHFLVQPRHDRRRRSRRGEQRVQRL